MLFTAKYPTVECPSFEEAIARFISEAPALEDADLSGVVCVVGLPSDVKNNKVGKRLMAFCYSVLDLVVFLLARIANIPHWVDTDGDAVATKLGLGKIVLLNDFESACWGNNGLVRNSFVICNCSEVFLCLKSPSLYALTLVFLSTRRGRLLQRSLAFLLVLALDLVKGSAGDEHTVGH